MQEDFFLIEEILALTYGLDQFRQWIYRRKVFFSTRSTHSFVFPWAVESSPLQFLALALA